MRMASDQANHTIKLVEERKAEAFFFTFVPFDRVSNFLIGYREEADFHYRRYLAITSSYETVGILPAL